MTYAGVVSLTLILLTFQVKGIDGLDRLGSPRWRRLVINVLGLGVATAGILMVFYGYSIPTR
jgi:hypothetical protein